MNSTKKFNLKIEAIADEFGLSPAAIRSRINDGSFIYDKHYIDVRKKGAVNAQIRFNLEACQELFKTPPEKR